MANKIVERAYLIETATSPSTLQSQVNTCMGNGYVPIGGISVVFNLPTINYYQALVKKEVKDAE